MTPGRLSLVVLLLLGLDARAGTYEFSTEPGTVGGWLVHAVSVDALQRMRGAVEIQAGYGYGTFTDTSTAAFHSSSAGVMPGPLFSGGMGFRLAASYRGRTVGFGLEGDWYNLGNDILYMPGSSPTLADAFSANEYAVFERLHLTSPDSRLQLSFDLREGWSVLNDSETLENGAPASHSFSGGMVGARLNFGGLPYAALPGLQLGAFVGASAWFPMSECFTGVGPSQCSGSGLGPNFQFVGGIAGTFTLPVRGPADYVLVVSRPTPAPDSRGADVAETPAFQERRGGIHQVAVLAPSSCDGEDASRCGRELAEIERTLLKRGFGVISWREVSATARDAQLKPEEAAARLGAQVLFQVKTLGRVTETAAGSPALERSFFTSDAEGMQGAPVALQASERAAIEPVLIPANLAGPPKTRVGARLYINAVLVPTGERLWSFRRQRMESGAAFSVPSTLIRRTGLDGWVREDPPGFDGGRAAEEERDAMVAATQQVAYYRLLRQLVTECVEQFAGPER